MVVARRSTEISIGSPEQPTLVVQQTTPGAFEALSRRTILGEGLVLCLVGLAVVLGMALFGSRAAQGVFYGVSPALLGPAVQASRTGVAKALRSGG